VELEQLERDVRALSVDIGARNLAHPDSLTRARVYIADRLTEIGFVPRVESYRARSYLSEILVGEKPGAAATVVVGAHYDTHGESPGADDNATGVATLLAIAEALRDRPLRNTVRFVAFPNEERPYTRTRAMGSRVYAMRCRARRDRVDAMLSLEMLGAQRKITVVSNLRSRHLARTVHENLRPVHARRLVLPGFLPLVKSSDHWSFWKEGYPAVMITDGGPLTYPHYHRRTDQIANVDFNHLGQVTSALIEAVAALAGSR
jgi:Zn-dependent M28 family amino/carboxypeptidase